MKNRIALLAALAALTIASQASAEDVLLLSDSFNTPGDANNGFNGNTQLTADQSGLLATKTYSIATQGGNGGRWAFQRGNNGQWLMVANTTQGGTYNMSGSVNNNFATQANDLGQALEFSFNMNVLAPMNGDNDNWSSFGIGSSQNAFINSASYSFSSLFRVSGGTEQFANGAGISGSPTWANGGQQIRFVVSDATGEGSAFNSDGATDIVKMYTGSTLAKTFTGLNFDQNDGFISFMTYGAVSQIDNLSVSAVPEPSSVLLAGLGALSIVIILHRRRAQA